MGVGIPILISAPPRTLLRSGRFWIVVGGLLVVRLTFASMLNLIPDEAFYWTWTRHLAGGYLDHPPMIAWLMYLSTRVLGNTELGVRFFAVIMPFATVLVLVWLAEKGSGTVVRSTLRDVPATVPDPVSARRGGLVVAAVLLTSPLFTMLATVFTPDTPAIFFCVLAMACVLTIVESQSLSRSRVALLWALFGVFSGLALLSKYTAILLPAAVFLALLTSRAGRDHLRRPGIYLSGLIALAVFWPVIHWNWQHEWASFSFQLGHGMSRDRFTWLQTLTEPLAFIGGQALPLMPVLFALGIVALVSYWRRAWSQGIADAHRNPLPRERGHGTLTPALSRSTGRGGKEESLRLSQVNPSDDGPALPATRGEEQSLRLSQVTLPVWVLLWSATFPLAFFLYASSRSRGQLNWPDFAYFPLALLMAAYLSEKWDGQRMRWAKIGCAVALGGTLVLHVLGPAVSCWAGVYRARRSWNPSAGRNSGADWMTSRPARLWHARVTRTPARPRSTCAGSPTSGASTAAMLARPVSITIPTRPISARCRACGSWRSPTMASPTSSRNTTGWKAGWYR